MNAKSKNGINNLKYGEIHMYYPLKFNTEIDIDQVCRKIEKSDILFTEEHEKSILSALQKRQEEIIANLNEEGSIPSDIDLRITDNKDYLKNNKFAYTLDEDELMCSVGFTEDSINLNFEHSELINIYNRREALDNEFNLSKEIYGFNFTHSHDRYILLPCKVKLNNNETVWLNCLLYIFNNSMGILKFELPLVNVDIEPLQKNDLNLYIKEVSNKWNDKFSTLTNLEDVANTYISILVKNLDIDMLNCIIKYNDIKHVIFSDFEGLPNNINSIPNEIQEDIYSIVSAPLEQIEGISYKSEARNHFNNYSWETKTTKNILKTTGGCLSIVDRNFINHITKSYKGGDEEVELEDYDYRNINEHVAINISINTEFALIITILKKMISSDYFFSKTSSLKDMFELNNDYYRNIIFINEIQEECYGSVTEQIMAFEEKMPYYLKKEITKEKSIAANKILEQYKQKNESELQYFITLVGLIISVLFGLPAINETLTIIRNILYFIPNDISYIKLYHLSAIIWLIFNLTIIYKIFSNKRDSPYK